MIENTFIEKELREMCKGLFSKFNSSYTDVICLQCESYFKKDKVGNYVEVSAICGCGSLQPEKVLVLPDTRLFLRSIKDIDYTIDKKGDKWFWRLKNSNKRIRVNYRRFNSFDACALSLFYYVCNKQVWYRKDSKWISAKGLKL